MNYEDSRAMREAKKFISAVPDSVVREDANMGAEQPEIQPTAVVAAPEQEDGQPAAVVAAPEQEDGQPAAVVAAPEQEDEQPTAVVAGQEEANAQPTGVVAGQEEVNAQPAPARTWTRYGSELVESIKAKLYQAREWSYNNIILRIYNATFAPRVAIHFNDNSESMQAYDSLMQDIKKQLTWEKQTSCKKSTIKTFAEKIETTMNRLPLAERNWAQQQDFAFQTVFGAEISDMYHEVERYRILGITAKQISDRKDLIAADCNISDGYRNKMDKAYSAISAVQYLGSEFGVGPEMITLNLGPRNGIVWGVSSSVFDRNVVTEAEIVRLQQENPLLETSVEEVTSASAPPVSGPTPAPRAQQPVLEELGHDYRLPDIEAQKILARDRLVLMTLAVQSEYQRRFMHS